MEKSDMGLILFWPVYVLLDTITYLKLTVKSRHFPFQIIIEPWHEISNNVVCATSKASDQPAHTRSLIRAFASRLTILWSLTGGLTDLSESTLLKLPHCWKSHVAPHIISLIITCTTNFLILWNQFMCFGECSGWSESLLVGAQIIFLVFFSHFLSFYF